LDQYFNNNFFGKFGKFLWKILVENFGKFLWKILENSFGKLFWKILCSKKSFLKFQSNYKAISGTNVIVAKNIFFFGF